MKTITNAIKIAVVVMMIIFSKTISAQCAANFIWSINSGGNVTFTSTSTLANSVTTVYHWTYGNGIPTYSNTGSAGMFPNYTYSANGIYTVNLFIISTSPTCSNNTNFTINVTTVPSCSLVANFSYTQGTNGFVIFGNTTAGTSSTTTYFWNFGNGNTSTVTSPSTTYSANGSYVATLTANNNFSPTCISTKTVSFVINNICTLNASFLGPSTSSPGVMNFFNNSTGTVSGATYTWNFGNGVNSNSINPIVTYTVNGTYNVTLTANNNTSASCISSNVIPITVVNICSLNPSFTSTNNGAGTYTFFGTSGINSGMSSYTLAWGSGTINAATGIVLNNIPTYSIVHTFTSGTYTIALTVNNFTSSPSCTSSISQTISVNTNTCNVNANFNASLGTNGLVSFSNTSTGTTSASTYSWNFGNGNTSNLISPSITYTGNGVYTVTLIVTGSGSLICSSTKTIALSVTNSTCLLAAHFVPNSFTNSVMGYTNTTTGIIASTSYTWNFQNGTSSNQFNPPPQSYTANGNYTTSLTANNGTICTSMFSRIDTICSFIPAITFTQGLNGNVTFSTNAVSANYVNAYWQFLNPNVSFNTAYGTVVTRTLSNGAYTPTLYVDYSPTCHKMVTTSLTVINNPCGLAASFSHTIGSNGLVNFLSTTSGTTFGTTFNWNFGDGWFSNSVNPNHTYSNGGVHYVSLALVDTSNGYCVSTATMALNITGIACQANANFSLVPTNTPQYWNAILAYPYNITSAIWNWGDGSNSNVLYASHQYSAAANYSICLSVTASCGSSATACYTYNIYKGAQGSSNVIYVNVVQGQSELETGIVVNNFENRMEVYPNPNSGNFKVILSDVEENSANIEVTDVLGKTIYVSKNEIVNKQMNAVLHLEDINNGLYFIKVVCGNKQMTQKIVISK